jgi:antitoxin CptB
MMDLENGASLEERRKRLLFRSQRRGFKEVDLVFGTFAVAEAMRLGADEVTQFEALLDAADHDVYAWLTGFQPVPPEHDTPLFARLKALCQRKTPTWNV